MLVQSPLHRLDPLFQAIVQLALLLMIFLILLERSFVRASLIETSHLHFVYQAFADEIFLHDCDLLFAGQAFAFQGDANRAESVATWMDPLRILHQSLAGRAVKVLRVGLVDQLVLLRNIWFLLCLFAFGFYVHVAGASCFAHQRVKLIFQIYEHNTYKDQLWCYDDDEG